MTRTIPHICITDDNMDDYYLFKTALEEVNESVKLTHFSSCCFLLDYLKVSDHLPSLVVIDMKKPVPNDYRCMDALKKESRMANIPVVIYSNATMPFPVQNASENGAHKYLVKPYSIELIKEYIREWLVA